MTSHHAPTRGIGSRRALSRILSGEDRRLLRRAATLTGYTWSALEVLFVAGAILPAVQGSEATLAQSVGFLGIAFLASLMFAGMFGGASVFLPERAFPTYARTLLGFVGVALGIVAITTCFGVGLAPSIPRILDSALLWALVGVVLMNGLIGLLLVVMGYRNLAATLPVPSVRAT